MRIVKRSKGNIDRCMRKISVIGGSVLLSVLVPLSAYASEVDVSAVTKPLDVIKVIVLAVLATIGYITAAINIGKFGEALKANDSSSLSMHGLGVAGGVIMGLAGTILGLMGL